MVTDVDEVYRLLIDANPWWEDGKVPAELTHEYHRRDYFVLRNEVNSRPISAVGGPRQVGKTTLLYQLIEHLLESSASSSRILFVNFDLPGLTAAAKSPLNDCLNIYADRVLGKPWRKSRDKVYIFLDEITKVDNWHRDLKGWFDQKYPIKFLISSSSLSELKSGAAASLTGRIATHLLLTWKFVDVLMYQTDDPRWNDTGLRLREAFASSVQRNDPRILERKLREVEGTATRGRAALRSTLDRYFLIDGFPELLESRDFHRSAARLREYLDLTVANDLSRVYQIRTPQLFYDLLGLLAHESGQLISYRNLADTLHVQERTIVDYLDHLESVFLVAQAQFFSESRAKRIRRQRKILLANPGLQNALLGRVDRRTLTDSALMGRLAEGIVHDHAKRLVYCLNPGPEPKAFYWRDRHDREVDVVVRIDDKAVPIEVKYRTDPHHDLDGLNAFLAAHPAVPFGLVVTRDLIEMGDRKLFLPLSHFLLMV
ncbi:MAG: ATP-binding protein [Thermoplasmata archaeon]